eukprot:Phypoly_transcript_09640.p1 GENE.Phypoly_transcript_09640~~Phypoly_transcript_09640.p1  ORF type:complete len:390 (+),score=84.98 Phypoly_transcript_09640:105-1274(+)
MEAPAGYRVFVGGISWKADEAQLESFFSTHGQVLECKIIMDKMTGKSKGYGFVTFKDANAAEFVKQTANFSFLGKNMNVGDAVRKASEPNGANHTRPPHGNYNNNGYHQPYYTPNYYNRQNDTQFYGQYSPDGTFYPAYYYPQGPQQGFRGNPQYQYGGQNGYSGYPTFSPEGEQPVSSDSTSPPNYAPYAPYSPTGSPNYTPYYNNPNYYNAYYYPYSAAGGGGYPPYGYNQGVNPAQPEGGEEGVAQSAEQSAPPHSEATQPHSDHVNTTPAPTTETTLDNHSTSTVSTPPPTTTTASESATSEPQPIPQRPAPNTHPNAAISGSPRAQGAPRSAPKSQQKPAQQYNNSNNKQKQPKTSPSHPRPPTQDALHSHVIPSLSKLSVSSN